MSEARRQRRKRMTLPKKKEDLEKIVDEVAATHEHEHHHHHHHHGGDVEELITVFEILIDSLNANLKSLEATVQAQGAEIVRLYKILSKVVEACFEDDAERRRAALNEALAIVRQVS